MEKSNVIRVNELCHGYLRVYEQEWGWVPSIVNGEGAEEGPLFSTKGYIIGIKKEVMENNQPKTIFIDITGKIFPLVEKGEDLETIQIGQLYVGGISTFSSLFENQPDHKQITHLGKKRVTIGILEKISRKLERFNTRSIYSYAVSMELHQQYPDQFPEPDKSESPENIQAQIFSLLILSQFSANPDVIPDILSASMAYLNNIPAANSHGEISKLRK